jgi:hypothetical protein
LLAEVHVRFASKAIQSLRGSECWTKRSRESGRFMDVKKKQEKVKGVRREDKASAGERVQIDEETWHALEVLRRDKMATFQELMDQAVSDFLKKHHRPVTLKQALKERAKRRSKKAAMSEHPI